MAGGHYVVLGETLDGQEQTYGLGWGVTKCAMCHGTMRKQETKCFLCGAELPPDPNKKTLQERFATVVKGAMIFSAVLTVASLFTSFTPSFVKCSIITVVLGLVMKSAEQMKANQ